ncbi:MAG: hypothetical protein N3G22_03350 [Candidatus Micrarchaeota archaeon]|nr:hypothetical protein [Candidatus Micrarchaeota archaeon]
MLLFQVESQQESKKVVPEEISKQSVLISEKIRDSPRTSWSAKGFSFDKDSAIDKKKAEARQEKVLSYMKEMGFLSSDWKKEDGLSENEFKLFQCIFAMWTVREEKYTRKFFEPARDLSAEDALLKMDELIQSDKSIGAKSKVYWSRIMHEIIGEVKQEEETAPPQKERKVELKLHPESFNKVKWVEGIANDPDKTKQFFDGLKKRFEGIGVQATDEELRSFAKAVESVFSDKGPVYSPSDPNKPLVPLNLAIGRAANNLKLEQRTPEGLLEFLFNGEFSSAPIGLEQSNAENFRVIDVVVEKLSRDEVGQQLINKVFQAKNQESSSLQNDDEQPSNEQGQPGKQNSQ